MSQTIKQIVLVSASPKVEQKWAVSAFLAKHGEEKLSRDSLTVTTIPVRHVILHHETDAAFASLQDADAIVLIFPLYFFCMPAMLTRFLQDFVAKEPKAAKDCAVYALVNCGFPEPEINLEAMRVVEQFALQTGRSYGGGVMIGCGGMILGAQGAPFMRDVMEQINALFARVDSGLLHADSIESKIVATAPKFPRALYFLAGNAGWRSTARKNHLKNKDLYRTPYRTK